MNTTIIFDNINDIETKKKVQEIAFKYGYAWSSGQKILEDFPINRIFFRKYDNGRKTLTHSSSPQSTEYYIKTYLSSDDDIKVTDDLLKLEFYLNGGKPDYGTKKLVYENKSSDKKRIIMLIKSNEECIEAQKIGFENGYSWSSCGTHLNHSFRRTHALFFNVDSYITFSMFSIEKIIEYCKKCDNNSYILLDDISKLDYILKRNGKIPDYNKPNNLVYESSINKIMRFDEFDNFDNLEYRKGSKEFGGILTRLLEFLRIYKKIDDTIQFTISDFEKKSNINIDEIKKLIQSKESGMNLFDFNIVIDNNLITFSNFINIKNRPFESNNS